MISAMPTGRVDVHTHIVCPNLPRPSSQDGRHNLTVRQEGDRLLLQQGGRTLRSVPRTSTDPEARLRVMDDADVGCHTLLPLPPTLLPNAPLTTALSVARRQNDYIADFVSSAPDRFVGFGSVPLQDVHAAVEELLRSKHELGLRGVEIVTHLPNRDLDDPGLDPFYATAVEQDMPVFVHPVSLAGDQLSSRLGLQFGLGFPLATARAIAAVLFGGVLERHPRLRLCFAHGGGCVASLVGRWSAGYERRPGGKGRGLLENHPRDALRSLWVDSLVYDPSVLRLAIDVFGNDRVLLGSDYPLPTAENPPGEAIMAMLQKYAGDAVLERQLTSHNALRFLGFVANEGA